MDNNFKHKGMKGINRQINDQYGLKEFLDKNFSNINLVQNFFPFSNNNVLTIQMTSKGIFILINNLFVSLKIINFF